MYEIELKYKVDDLSVLENNLFNLREPMLMIDSYYDHPLLDLVGNDQWLRVRRTSYSQSLVFKGPSDGATRKELEFNINADDMKAFLSVLGFVPLVDVKKSRREASVPWTAQKQVTICLDEVEGLGSYVELEIVSEDDSTEAREFLDDLAEKLNLTNLEKRGYAKILVEKLNGKTITA